MFFVYGSFLFPVYPDTLLLLSGKSSFTCGIARLVCKQPLADCGVWSLPRRAESDTRRNAANRKNEIPLCRHHGGGVSTAAGKKASRINRIC